MLAVAEETPRKAKIRRTRRSRARGGWSRLEHGGRLVDANVASWLASVDREDPALLEFARRLDDACREAERVTGRELPARHAAAIVLRIAAA